MRAFRSAALVVVMLAAAGCTRSKSSETPTADLGGNGLKAPSAFSAIRDDGERAKALFEELSKVLQHPRCINCHPQGEGPLQGDDQRPHEPHVVRGNGGLGAPGMFCTTCHGQKSYLNVPGNPKWVLAPAEMAWVGKSTAEICAMLKDKKRNGGRDLDAVHRHLAKDPLVSYGWSAPEHLESAPGNQATVAALFRAWMDAGAACPKG